MSREGEPELLEEQFDVRLRLGPSHQQQFSKPSAQFVERFVLGVSGSHSLESSLGQKRLKIAVDAQPDESPPVRHAIQAGSHGPGSDGAPA